MKCLNPLDSIQDDSRSAIAFNHAPNATLARLAARRYLSFSAGVTRISTRAVAGSVEGGRPRGRFGWSSIPALCAVQIMLDKPFLALYSVRTLTKQTEPKMKLSTQDCIDQLIQAAKDGNDERVLQLRVALRGSIENEINEVYQDARCS